MEEESTVIPSEEEILRLRNQLRELDNQRNLIEVEAHAIAEELSSPLENGEPGPGINGSLLDSEGFPRADIDIMRVRTLRNRLAHLRTDHKDIMKRIEHLLPQLHEMARLIPLPTVSNTAPSPAQHPEPSQQVNGEEVKDNAENPEESTQPSEEFQFTDPFCRVNQVRHTFISCIS